MDEGWYPDPADADRQRWWDGLVWTEFVRNAPPAQPDSLGRRVPVREQLVHAPDTDTPALSWIAWSPFLLTLVLLPALLLGWGVALASALAPTIALLGAVALFVFAVRDARELSRRGFPRRPSALWMLLGPVVYLFARWRALGEGRTPLVVCLVQLAVIGGGVFIYQAVALGLGAASQLSSQ